MSSALPLTSSGTVATPLAPKQANEREQLHKAAQQFEAIFVRQMLAAARSSSHDDSGLFDSQALGTFRQMQDDKFAEITAQTGTLGLASIIEAQIARHLPQEKQ